LEPRMTAEDKAFCRRALLLGCKAIGSDTRDFYTGTEDGHRLIADTLVLTHSLSDDTDWWEKAWENAPNLTATLIIAVASQENKEELVGLIQEAKVLAMMKGVGKKENENE